MKVSQSVLLFTSTYGLSIHLPQGCSDLDQMVYLSGMMLSGNDCKIFYQKNTAQDFQNTVKTQIIRFCTNFAFVKKQEIFEKTF